MKKKNKQKTLVNQHWFCLVLNKCVNFCSITAFSVSQKDGILVQFLKGSIQSSFNHLKEELEKTLRVLYLQQFVMLLFLSTDNFQ